MKREIRILYSYHSQLTLFLLPLAVLSLAPMLQQQKKGQAIIYHVLTMLVCHMSTCHDKPLIQIPLMHIPPPGSHVVLMC